MLGLRLSPEIERRLDRFVHRRGLRKSDVARSALVDYLDRHERDDDFERQVAVLAAFESADRSAEIDELNAAAWRTVDEL